MVLMHTEKEKCESLLETYQKALVEVKLISHKPQPFTEYNREFWNEKLKSKLPYKWAINYRTKEYSKRNVPWLSFVGYQIRYDGAVRVRKKSIKKMGHFIRCFILRISLYNSLFWFLFQTGFQPTVRSNC